MHIKSICIKFRNTKLTLFKECILCGTTLKQGTAVQEEECIGNW